MSASDQMNYQKANQSKKSNLTFQALLSEKQQACIWINEYHISSNVNLQMKLSTKYVNTNQKLTEEYFYFFV